MSMLDVSTVDSVEIQIVREQDGLRVWVNVSGLCRLRAYRVGSLRLDVDPLVLKQITEK